MMRTLSKSFSLVHVFVLFMLVASVMGGLQCSADSECRRDVCIFRACLPRATTGKTCQTNNHCLKASTDSCIFSKCLARSPSGGNCDDASDCSLSGSVCSSSKCVPPSGSTCSLNSDCISPLVCINKQCLTKSSTGGDCDDVDDCTSTGDTCSGGKCTFSPSLLVWEGNQTPLNPSGNSPSVAVNGVLFVFEEYYGIKPVNVESYDPKTKTWTSKTGPGIFTIFNTVVAVGNSVFLIGGVIDDIPATAFFEYNTVTDSWDFTWAQLPEGRFLIGAAAVGTTVFVFGGLGESKVRLDSIRSLDVSNKNNAWNLLSTATLPTGTNSLSAATVGTDIYITGGITSSGTIDTVLKFNSLTPTISPSSTNLQPMTMARSEHMSFYDPTNKRLYAVGPAAGKNTVEYLDLSVSSSGPWVSANAPNYADISTSTSGGFISSKFHFVSLRTLQIIDVSSPSSVKWSPFANSPCPVAPVFHLTSPTKITAVDTIGLTIAFYDTVSDTWSVGVPSSNYPIIAFSPGSALVNGEVYVMGGDGGGSAGFPTVYALDTSGKTWTQMDDMPAGRTGGCAAADGTDIYFFGGAPDANANPVNLLYKMDTKKTVGSGQWSEVTPAGATPLAVGFCAAVVVGQKLLIFGGGTGADGATPTGLIQSFDIPSQTWDSPLSEIITPRSKFSAVFLKGFVFVIGGTDDGAESLAKVEVFDVTSKTVSTIKDIPSPRYSLGSVSDGSSIFSLGGRISISTTYFPSLEKLRTP